MDVDANVNVDAADVTTDAQITATTEITGESVTAMAIMAATFFGLSFFCLSVETETVLDVAMAVETTTTVAGLFCCSCSADAEITAFSN